MSGPRIMPPEAAGIGWGFRESMDLQHKLESLADAAKYDASCASSGAARKDSRGGKGAGSTGGAGI